MAESAMWKPDGKIQIFPSPNRQPLGKDGINHREIQHITTLPCNEICISVPMEQVVQVRHGSVIPEKNSI